MPAELKYRWRYVLVLSAGVFFAFGNSFNGTFVFGDHAQILENAALSELTNLRRVLFEYPNSTHPVVALSFAIDRALWGGEARFYHLFNFAAHLAAALLLFGCVRRTLESARLKERFGESAGTLACGAALLWAVHPLQTEAVTYLAERAESLMDLFFLLSLYALIRGAAGAEDSAEATRAGWWNALAVAAALLGAGCKQVISVLPVFALLYDRCFISGTFRAALRRAPRLYVGLCAVWVVVAVTLSRIPHGQLDPEKFGVAEYARSQCVVLACYLQLAFWPAQQCLDYAWPVEHDWGRILPCAALVLALLGLTVWGVVRNASASLCGAWSFLILAPTSSFLPQVEMAAERRMALPLAGLSVLVVCALYRALRHTLSAATASRLLIDGALLLAIGLCVLTGWRNTLYYDEFSMWQDVLRQRPDNPRALLFVGNYEREHGHLETAETHLRRAAEIKRDDSDIVIAYGTLHFARNDFKEAEAAFRKALSVRPSSAHAWKGLADALLAQKREPESIAALEQAASYAHSDAVLWREITKQIEALKNPPIQKP